ncbi:MAG: hypothetical protein JO157_08465 [Acetobacteraceae bacterium]|nr:hypothetical protein [Acetobacteraceae bacterium]
MRRIAGPIRQEVREARRSMRLPLQRPKAPRPRPSKPAPTHPDQRPPISATEAEAEFREALHRAGLRFGPRDRLQMDGQRHYLLVESSRSRRGFYVAHLDGEVPAGTIINHRTG